MFEGLKLGKVLGQRQRLRGPGGRVPVSQVTGEETYERDFGNLKLIKDNYPKYVVTMDPNVGLIHDSGIVACSARQFLMDLMS